MVLYFKGLNVCVLAYLTYLWQQELDVHLFIVAGCVLGLAVQTLLQGVQDDQLALVEVTLCLRPIDFLAKEKYISINNIKAKINI